MATQHELYDAATHALPKFEEIVRSLAEGAGVRRRDVRVAPLKGRARAGAKAAADYGGAGRDASLDGPGCAWVFDVVRAAVVFDRSEKVKKLWIHLLQLEKRKIVKVVRVKNRCANPLFHGWRDILVNLQVKVEVRDGVFFFAAGAGTGAGDKRCCWHTCEPT